MKGKKEMKKILISLIAAIASVGMVVYGAPSTVSSYAAPNLVSEINTALANPEHTTLTVDGKSTLKGELDVAGVGTFTATPVCKDGISIGTNANIASLTASKCVFTDGSKNLSSTGTLGIDQGGTGGGGSWTSNGVLLGKADSAFGVTAAGTDGQVFLGNTGDEPAFATMSQDATITAAGVVTVNKGLAMTNGASLQNIPASTALAGVVPIANGGAGNVSGILKANGAGLVSAASAGTDYLAPNTVWGYPGLATVTNFLENTVTATAKDTAGATLPGYRLFHVWVSETDKGAATTNNIETLVLSTGTAVATVTANADYWYCSAVDGTAVATVTATAAGTNYLMVADGSSISSIALVEVAGP